MDIVNVKVKDLIPYEKNPRYNDEAVEYVANSIREFGFKVPIVIDKNNVVVCGHTRLKASKLLKIKEVPCVVADDLTDEQIKAFRLADNKVSEKAEWDFDLLDDEIEELSDLFDFSDFGFDLFDPEEEHERQKELTDDKKYNILNLETAQFEGVGKYDIPEILPVYELPEVKEWIPFNYVMSDEHPEGKGVHFFIDDYQFERVWNNPTAYVEKLRQYTVVASPDFSPFGDMPMATQIYNHYRKHWCARFWQENGVTVIPTLRGSSDPRSKEWCFDGEPKGGIVILSSMWGNREELKEGNDEKWDMMMEIIKPKKIFVYGDPQEDLGCNYEIINSFSENRFR